MKQVVFVCVKCAGGRLRSTGQVLACEACGAEYEFRNGVPDFAHDAEFYWGELERKAMSGILNDSACIHDQLADLLHTSSVGFREYLLHYAFDRRRAGWKFLLALPEGGRALDFGCGWGGLSLSLVNNVGQLVVSDIVPERVAVVVRRAREMGKDNIIGCTASGWPRLPFEDGAFDLVVLNGVLEWIPSSIPGDPKEIQQAFLAEVSRVLKPSGQLYVGIENRFGAAYFRGRREDHTKLPYISLIPRPLAKVYHRLRKKSPFRTYTHGRGALARMMVKAGFDTAHFYCPYPDYREFDRMVDLHSKVRIEDAFAPRTKRGKIALAIVRRTRLFGWVANSFGVVGYKRARTPSFLDRLIVQMVSDGLISEGVEYRTYRVTPSAVANVGLLEVSGGRSLLSLPLDDRAASRIRRLVDTRGRVDFGRLPEDVNRAIPHCDSGVFEGEPFLLEAFIAGRRARTFTRTEMDAVERTCLAWLGRFHASTSAMGPVRIDSWAQEDGFRCAVEKSALAPSWDRLLNGVQGMHLITASIHGDFHSGNLLIDSSGTLAGVIDWDLFHEDGLPLWDVLTFKLHLGLERGESWGRAYKQAAESVLSSIGRKESLSSYVQHCCLAEPDCWAAILTFPFLHVYNKVTYGNDDSDVILADLEEVYLELWQRGASFIGDGKDAAL